MNCEKTVDAAAPAQLDLTAGSTTLMSTPGLQEVIANAKTAAEHRQLADYFAQQAADYDAEASAHDWSLDAYTTGVSAYPATVIGHCRQLRSGLADAAKAARALEQAHRQLADGMAG